MFWIDISRLWDLIPFWLLPYKMIKKHQLESMNTNDNIGGNNQLRGSSLMSNFIDLVCICCLLFVVFLLLLMFY